MVTVFSRKVTKADHACKVTKFKAFLEYVTTDSKGNPIYRDVTRHGATKQDALCRAYESLMRREEGRK